MDYVLLAAGLALFAAAWMLGSAAWSALTIRRWPLFTLLILALALVLSLAMMCVLGGLGRLT